MTGQRRAARRSAARGPSMSLAWPAVAVAGLWACAVASAVAGAHREAFAVASAAQLRLRGGVRAAAGGRAPTRSGRRSEPFDPFGWKSGLKDSVQGLMDSLSDDEEPSKVEEQMIVQIFSRFDTDSDGVLNIEEFNTLQVATEGEEAVYNSEQLKQLLLAVNPDIEAPERGMPFADYRRLYVQRNLRTTYGTDVRRDHAKIFGEKGAEALEAAVAAASDGLTVGTAVKVQGLSGAVELNGQKGRIAEPSKEEADMVAEGRVIVLLDSNSDRVALKPANIARTEAAPAPQVD